MEFSNLKFLKISGNKKSKYFFQTHKFTTKSHSNIQTHLIKYKITISKSTHVY